VNLHERAERDVKRILAAYGAELSDIRGYIDQSVQEAGGYWEDPNPDFVSIDPGVRTGHVRQWTAGLAAKVRATRRKASASSPPLLKLKVVSFAGLHWYTLEGERIRTRTRPMSGKRRRPMHAAPPDEGLFRYDDLASSSETSDEPGVLFGHDPGAEPYEVSILMDIDPGAKTLQGAWLAAIDWGPDDKGRMIYYEEEIPAPPMKKLGDPGDGGTAVPPGAGGPAEDGFSDFLNEEGEETGTDPA
jgi:hypothetical protein